jgi:hypothetical protein
MKYKRTFIHLSRAYYADANLKNADFIDEISLSLEEDDAHVGGFHLRWIDLGDEIAPKLEVFDDAWEILIDHFGDFLRMLGSYDHSNWTPDKIAVKLAGLGIEDCTPLENSHV